MFARLALDQGFTLHVVLPFENYAAGLPDDVARAEFEALLSRASQVETLPGGHASKEDAYFRASQRIVAQCDLVIAVWNGEPAKGHGGTADVVSFAESLGKELVILDPLRKRIDGGAEPQENPRIT
jgi:hypothetical protein